jgi:hypothetical protein
MAIVDANSLTYDTGMPQKKPESAKGVVDASSIKYDKTPKPESPSSAIPKTLGQKLWKRAQDVGEDMTGHIPTETYYDPVRRGFHAAGAIAGGIGDVVGSALSSNRAEIFDPNLPKRNASGWSKSLIDMGIAAAKKGQQYYDNFSTAHPEEAKDIESTINIATLLPIGRGAKAGEEAIEGGVKAATGAVERSVVRHTPVPLIDKQIDSVIDRGVTQGVKPLTRAGGRTVPGAERVTSAGHTIVRDIVENKEGTVLHDASGDVVKNNLPRSAPQMVESVGQGLRRNVKGCFDAIKKVTGQDVQTSADRVLHDLKSFADDPVNQTANPEAVRYARKRIRDFSVLDKKNVPTGAKSFNPEQFERLLQDQTSRKKTLINNPTKDIDRLHVEARVEKALRETQDEVMNKFDGPEYRRFKNNYAAYKQLEADVIQRARVVTRQGPYSLIDFSDVYSLPEILGGVATGNAAMVGKGLLTKGISKYIKYANHPDTIIDRMFSTTDSLMQKRARAVAEQEKNVAQEATKEIINGPALSTAMSYRDLPKSHIMNTGMTQADYDLSRVQTNTLASRGVGFKQPGPVQPFTRSALVSPQIRAEGISEFSKGGASMSPPKNYPLTPHKVIVKGEGGVISDVPNAKGPTVLSQGLAKKRVEEMTNKDIKKSLEDMKNANDKANAAKFQEIPKSEPRHPSSSVEQTKLEAAMFRKGMLQSQSDVWRLRELRGKPTFQWTAEDKIFWRRIIDKVKNSHA